MSEVPLYIKTSSLPGTPLQVEDIERNVQKIDRMCKHRKVATHGSTNGRAIVVIVGRVLI